MRPWSYAKLHSRAYLQLSQVVPCEQVVSVCTFLLQWGGCCVQHTDHTGTHVRVQFGWGYGFDMHRGGRFIEGVSQQLSCPYLGCL